MKTKRNPKPTLRSLIFELMSALQGTLPMVEYFHQREGCPATLRNTVRAIADARRTLASK